MQKNTIAAGQARHGAGAIAALIAGVGLAETDQADALQQVLTMLGVTPEIQIALGALVVAAAHLMSAHAKRRPQ